MLKFSTTERNGQLLQHDGYSYIRYTTKEHKNGSINWRCQNSRNKVGCKAICSTLGNTITRYTKVAHTKERAKNQLRKQFKEEAKYRFEDKFLEENEEYLKICTVSYSKDE